MTDDELAATMARVRRIVTETIARAVVAEQNALDLVCVWDADDDRMFADAVGTEKEGTAWGM